MKTIEKLTKLHLKWDILTSKYSAMGAADTEPDFHYQDHLRSAIIAGTSFKGLTASQWELYSQRPGANRVATLLNNHTKRMVNLIVKTPQIEMGEIREWAKRELWRVNIS